MTHIANTSRHKNTYICIIFIRIFVYRSLFSLVFCYFNLQKRGRSFLSVFYADEDEEGLEALVAVVVVDFGDDEEGEGGGTYPAPTTGFAPRSTNSVLTGSL